MVHLVNQLDNLHVPLKNTIFRNAFTLIELLVVISIVSLLMAILLPALAAARESARRIKCGTQLRQIGMAGLMYADENDGTFPGKYWAKHYNPGSNQSGIADYVKVDPDAAHDTLFSCQSIQQSTYRTQMDAYRTYTMNLYLAYDKDPIGSSLKLKTHSVIKPSAMSFYTDGRRFNDPQAAGWYWYYQLGSTATVNRTNQYVCPHNSSMNVVYVDGHTQTIPRQLFLDEYKYGHPFWDGGNQ